LERNECGYNGASDMSVKDGAFRGDAHRTEWHYGVKAATETVSSFPFLSHPILCGAPPSAAWFSRVDLTKLVVVHTTLVSFHVGGMGTTLSQSKVYEGPDDEQFKDSKFVTITADSKSVSATIRHNLKCEP